MKRVLLFGQNTARLQNFADRCADDEIEIEVTKYDDLCFLIQNQEAQITLANTGRDLREYEKMFLITTPQHEKNHALNALACYGRKYGIEMYDDTFSNFSGKLYEMFCFWEAGLPVPDTAFGPAEFLVKVLEEKFGGTGVLKATHTACGKSNYLVHSGEEIRQILAENQEVSFILQNFIANDGDYRIIVLDDKPRMAIYRSSNGKDFRNNTSLGGSATLMPLEQVDAKALDLAVKAAQAFQVRIAGADIIQDKNTKKYYILEVNRTPQLLTAPPLEEKAEMLEKFIKEA